MKLIIAMVLLLLVGCTTDDYVTKEEFMSYRQANGELHYKAALLHKREVEALSAHEDRIKVLEGKDGVSTNARTY